MGNRRLNGELSFEVFESIKDVISWHDELSMLRFQAAILRYLGYKKFFSTNGYNFLVKKFWKENKFEFGDIYFPQVKEKHRRTFASEFGDLVAPYLWPSRKIWSAHEGNYEQFGICLHQDDVVIDAGANMGLFSVTAAAKGATVYAFEPVEDALNYLNEITRFYPKVFPVAYALMDYSGSLEMEFFDTNFSANSAVLKRNTGKKIIVNCITLDEWADSNDISRIDFIKADIEGAERFFLKGAVKTLQKYKPRLAICTYHTKEDPQLLQDIIIKANPDYKIFHNEKKLFAI